jgi:pimeloyl-ACP methyl ester carboxylesterase
VSTPISAPPPTALLTVDRTPVHLEGSGPDTLVMLHGWPDSLVLWDTLVARLATRRRCARFTLPCYDPADDRPAPTLDAMIAHVAAIVDAVSPQAPVTLVLHDWGAFYGYQYAMRHPDRVARIVGVDIGDTASGEYLRSLPARAKAMIVGYQSVLAMAYWMPARLGDAVTRQMARWLRAPAAPDTIRARLNYPYASMLGGGFRGARPLRVACPMLFVYGTRKPFLFHAPAWAERLAAAPDCAVKGLRTGHWVMTAEPEAFNRIVEDWLDGRG